MPPSVPPAPIAPIVHSRPPNESVVDLALISETFASDPSGVNSILRALRATNERDVEHLRQAVTDKDLNRVTYTSHRMLGAGKMLGAGDFTAVCQDLEDGSRAGDWEAIRGAMPAFEAQWARLKNYLDAF